MYLSLKRTEKDIILVMYKPKCTNPISPTEQDLYVNVTSERIGCPMPCMTRNLQNHNYKSGLLQSLKQLVPTMLGPRLAIFIPSTAVSFPMCKNQEFKSKCCLQKLAGGWDTSCTPYKTWDEARSHI